MCFAYQYSYHEQLGFSSLELLYDREVRGLLTLLYNKLTNHVEQENSVVEFVLTLSDILHRVLETKQHKDDFSKGKVKRWYDRKARE